MAATGRLGSRVDRQRAAWRTTAVSTSSTTWHTIPGLAFAGTRPICATGEVSVSVNLNLDGAPVLVRVRMANAAVVLSLRPGRARFVPGPGETSHSYTFVGRAGGFEADDRQSVRVQWRSPSGGVVTLTRGVVNVLFQRGTNCG
ncbi:MAG: hypothetical protein M3312_08085 [Actinomycetota bacterium]|nr:hypothetical protein [Actinomycetota bacterium]